MIRIAIIGLGHWGPNYLRNFSQMEGCTVVACADRDPSRLKVFRENHPQVRFYENVNELYSREKVDASVIATPTSTHYSIAQAALSAHQHLLIEKPLALLEKECVQLTKLAEKKKRILMVGHTFLYNSAVMQLKSILDNGEVGKVYYLHAVRTNLGPIREDVNSLIDLAPHDISVFLYLLGKKPVAVSANGASFLKPSREDVTFLTLYFEGGVLGHVHVSWLDPRKTRQITVIGDKKMVLFDDINVFEPIRIYDKGVKKPKEFSDFSEFKTVLYDGNVVIPKVQLSEPLRTQGREFISCIQNMKRPVSDGHFGTLVTRVLNGASKSLKQNGGIVRLAK